MKRWKMWLISLGIAIIFSLLICLFVKSYLNDNRNDKLDEGIQILNNLSDKCDSNDDD